MTEGSGKESCSHHDGQEAESESRSQGRCGTLAALSSGTYLFHVALNSVMEDSNGISNG